MTPKSPARILAAAAVAATTFAVSSSAEAAGLNTACATTPARPYPAVVVHGQGGNFEGMRGVTDALVRDGYCVYARNYGRVPGGQNGQDFLSVSADQINGLIDEALAKTGAQKVVVVGHSAGAGVLNNIILAKGGAARIHRMVSFGGLVHPYAHVGIPGVADAKLYLPNLTLMARRLIPGINVQDVVKTAVRLYAGAGQPLGPVDPWLLSTAESNFTRDLFEPAYWEALHGGQSEAPNRLIRTDAKDHSIATKDSHPGVCYLNIVGVTDMITGTSAGFQDEATNVENFVLPTPSVNGHNDMLGDPLALGKMLQSLGSPCAGNGVKTAVQAKLSDPTVEEQDAANAFEDAIIEDELGRGAGREGSRASLDGAVGCSASAASPGSSKGLGLLGFGLALVATVRRRRRK